MCTLLKGLGSGGERVLMLLLPVPDAIDKCHTQPDASSCL